MFPDGRIVENEFLRFLLGQGVTLEMRVPAPEGSTVVEVTNDGEVSSLVLAAIDPGSFTGLELQN